MKYFIACMVIPPAQILFMLAFTVCALSIGVSTRTGKPKPRKLPD